MQDEKIVELYWNRDESAVSETQEKYETYLYKIAYNILSDKEDSNESVNDTVNHIFLDTLIHESREKQSEKIECPI